MVISPGAGRASRPFNPEPWYWLKDTLREHGVATDLSALMEAASHHESSLVRATSIDLISRLEYTEAVPLLWERLAHDEALFVRADAAIALARLEADGGLEAAEQLMITMKDKRQQVIMAGRLAEFGVSSGAEFVTEQLLVPPKTSARSSAVRAASELIQMTDIDKDFRRELATLMLTSLRDEFDVRLRYYLTILRENLEAWFRADKTIEKLILEIAVCDSDEEARERAVLLLTELYSRHLTATNIHELVEIASQHENILFRRTAVDLLGRLEYREAVPELWKIVENDASPSVRIDAAVILARFGVEGGLDAIEKLMLTSANRIHQLFLAGELAEHGVTSGASLTLNALREPHSYDRGSEVAVAEKLIPLQQLDRRLRQKLVEAVLEHLQGIKPSQSCGVLLYLRGYGDWFRPTKRAKLLMAQLATSDPDDSVRTYAQTLVERWSS